MPGIFTIMDIARWSLQASINNLDTISHNVANVNTEGYSRQVVVQATRNPEETPNGWYGRGVTTVNVIQHVDALVLKSLTDKNSALTYNDNRLSQLKRLESMANEAGDTGLGKEITAFFNAWQDVSNNPESSAVRQVLRENANNLANRLQGLMSDLSLVKKDLGQYLSDSVSEANAICRRIADLNEEIVRGEATGTPANDFRDERQRLLNDLSGLLDIQWFETGSGSVTVMTGVGKTLVQASYPGKLDDDPLSFESVSGYTDNQLVWRDLDLVLDSDEITGGRIGASLKVREVDVPAMEDFLNDLAGSLIFEVNKLHSQGAGLGKFTDVTGTYESSNATVDLNDSSNTLPYKDLIQTGSFTVWVYEAGTRRDYTVNVSPTDSLTDIMDNINAAMNPTVNPSLNPVASITADNRLRLMAEGGIEFAFGGDDSNILAALGINTFFDGSTATSICVNQTITDSVRFIAAGRLLADGEHALGDNTNALAIADLKDTETMGGGNETFNEAVTYWASDLGTLISSTENNLNFYETATAQLKDMRDNVSAVNLDEEMIKMIQFQRSYQMAARLISVADTLLTTLLETKR